MPILSFIGLNGLVIISSFLVTFRLLRFRNLIDAVSFWFLMYLSQVIIIELALGMAGELTLQYCAVLNLAIFSCVWLRTKNLRSPWSAGLISGGVYSLLENKILRLGISILAGCALVKVAINLVNPPFGWDNLNYHFVFPVEWMKHGNLNVPITICDDPGPTYYPINGSLFFLWLMLPLRNVFLADLGQAPFFILLFLMAYNILRKMGVRQEYSLYAAILLLLIPNLMKQLEVAYVDVMVAALYLACINYIVSLEGEYSLTQVIACAVSAGLLLGTKTVALPYLFLLVPLCAYLFFKNVNKVYLSAIGVCVVLLLGGFSYARNFIQTHNPLYPLELAFGGKEIFKGVVDSATYRAHFKISDYALQKLLFHEGLGAQTTLFIFPAALLSLPLVLLKKTKHPRFILGYVLCLPVLLFLAFRYSVPLANTRYLYPLLGVGMIGAFFTLSRFEISKRAIRVIFLLCAVASMPEIASHKELIASAALSACIFFTIVPLLELVRPPGLLVRPFSVLLLCAIAASGLSVLNGDYVRNEYGRYITMQKYSGFWPDALEAWQWLNNNTHGNNIAYVGRPVAFPLYGTGFKNNVFYVSVNATDPAKLHYFPHSHYQWGYDFSGEHKSFEEKGNYRGDAEYGVWLQNLARRRAEYLFVYSLHQTETVAFPLEDGWARQNPARFVPVFSNETVHIYKINRELWGHSLNSIQR